MSWSFSVAALLAERAARQRLAPSRWIWTLAIVASLLLPTVVSSVSIELPSLFSPTVSQKMIVLRDATSVHLPTNLWGVSLTETSSVATDTDAWIKTLWMAASTGILAALVISVALVARRK